MALPIDDVVFTHHDGQAAAAMLDGLADADADAYGVEPGEKSTPSEAAPASSSSGPALRS